MNLKDNIINSSDKDELPKIGITGNSPFMFQGLNNKEIADHIENWLKERKLSN